MKDTEDLIRELSSGPVAVRRLPAPARFVAALVAACVACGVAGQLYLGVRPDLRATLADAYLWSELACLLLLLASSLVASVLVMYPDAYQHPGLTRLPYAVFGLLVVLCLVQMAVQPELRLQDATDMHGVWCTVSIAALALVPSALVMILLGRGAVVRPRQAGSLAVLTGTALGCLVVRLHEANDSMVHVVTWHYLPTVLCALVGVGLGRRLLRW
jgi:hypothetical protein